VIGVAELTGRHHARVSGTGRPRQAHARVDYPQQSTRRTGGRAMSEHEWIEPDAEAVRAILRDTRTVAIVGVSPNPDRPSYEVYEYLASASDYDLYLVNPKITELDGRPVYPKLADLPVVPDMVDVFRRYDQLPSVLDDAVAVGAKTLWLQLGLWHEQVARDAEAAGMPVVMDRCLKVEYARLR
jgi:predicted CoA-binding protein